jgi:hypothetical protein
MNSLGVMEGALSNSMLYSIGFFPALSSWTISLQFSTLSEDWKTESHPRWLYLSFLSAKVSTEVLYSGGMILPRDEVLEGFGTFSYDFMISLTFVPSVLGFLGVVVVFKKSRETKRFFGVVSVEMTVFKVVRWEVLVEAEYVRTLRRFDGLGLGVGRFLGGVM